MAYKGINNTTPYPAEPVFLSDEEGRDLLIVMVKSTYAINNDCELELSETQIPLVLGGEHYTGPNDSGLKFAPEACFAKEATDIAIIGHAWPPEGVAKKVDATVFIGNIQKTIRVFGDRIWKKKGLLLKTWKKTKPLPFIKIPIVWERAFGGQDLSAKKKKKHEFEKRNLIGTGMISKSSLLKEVPMPNIEDPKNLLKSPKDRPEPAGFGFISPEWEPRIQYAGTYDDAWMKKRMPLLPEDFKKRFLNAAQPDLISDGFLQGNENVTLVNISERGKLSFKLPGGKPDIQVKIQTDHSIDLDVVIDSLIINTDDHTVQILWRSEWPAQNRMYHIEEIVVSIKNNDEETEVEKQS